MCTSPWIIKLRVLIFFSMLFSILELHIFNYSRLIRSLHPRVFGIQFSLPGTFSPILFTTSTFSTCLSSKLTLSRRHWLCIQCGLHIIISHNPTLLSCNNIAIILYFWVLFFDTELKIPEIVPDFIYYNTPSSLYSAWNKKWLNKPSGRREMF